MQKICPRCGAHSDLKQFIGLFCEDCYAERLDVGVERKMEIKVCKKCGKLYSGGDWVPLNEKNLEKQLKRNVKGKYDSMRFVVPQEKEGECQAVILTRTGQSFFELVRQFSLVKHFDTCQNCSRATAGYFEAVIQVRSANPEKAEKLAEKVKHAITRKTFITRFEETTNGFDIYVGSNKATMVVLEWLGLKAEKSAKLHGVKDGQRIYRITYCVKG